ncbi:MULTISPECIES: FeoA family protein [Clostridium]|uniref:FeoA family protein n=1 Tax=Clostridium TaxID=1485 RepID=UPI0006D7761D|nr:ferrous iron transport protein A [Clostridium massiliamazoniense]
MSICDLKIGDQAIISNIEGNEKLTKRLLSLGCIEGTSIKLKRKAPLGDPLIITFRGFDIALRKKDAKKIYIQ